jgi:hypothetical protein
MYGVSLVLLFCRDESKSLERVSVMHGEVNPVEKKT